MTTKVFYDDGRVKLDQRGIMLRHYYFPLGRSKHIPYQRIQGIKARSMGWMNGKGRLWGTADPRYWFPLDLARPGTTQVVVLDVGGRVKPAFTPDDPDQVISIVTRQIAQPG